MKNTICTLSLALLSLSSLKADYIKKFIDKGRPDAIKALVKAGFTSDEERIKEYIALAQAKVGEKQAALDSFSLGKKAAYDIASHTIDAAVVGSLFVLAYGHYNDDSKFKDHGTSWTKNFVNWAGFVAAAGKGVQLGFKLYSDVKKQDKKQEAVETAEKVLKAVKELKVAVPQIADH